jgi:hypothetical protein
VVVSLGGNMAFMASRGEEPWLFFLEKVFRCVLVNVAEAPVGEVERGGGRDDRPSSRV